MPVQKDANIVEAIRRHNKTRPDDIAITFLIDGEESTATMTYGGLDAQARALAIRLKEKKPDAARAVIVQEPGLDFVLSLCACFYAGVAAIPTPPPTARLNSRSGERFSKLVHDAKPDIILTHSNLKRKMTWFAFEQAGLGGLSWLITDETSEPETHLSTVHIPPIVGQDLALIQYTSGSTSSPKGVLITHDNLSANLNAIAIKMSLTEGTKLLSWLPPYHDMGLIGGIIEALWVGCHLVLMDPKHFAQKPLRWLSAIDRYRIEVTGAANFAYDLCTDAADRMSTSLTFDMSCWRLAYSGAEPVRPGTIKRFAKTFANNAFSESAFYPTYGLAEATLMATGPNADSDRPRFVVVNKAEIADGTVSPRRHTDEVVAEHETELVSCGTPAINTILNIVNPDTQVDLPEGEIGEISLTGPAVSSGYWSGDSVAEPDVHSEYATLMTGDRGFLWQGEVYVTGRSKDLIIVRGKNFYPADIEEIAWSSHPSLQNHGIAAFGIDSGAGEQLVLACELKREERRAADLPEVLQAVSEQVSKICSLPPFDVVLLRPGALPRTTSGKLQRHACARAYLDKTWDPMASLRGSIPHGTSLLGNSSQAVEQIDFSAVSAHERIANLEGYLIYRLAQITGSSVFFLSANTNLEAAGLDSLKRIEFVLWLEQELEISLPFELLEEDLNISQLITEIQALIESSNTSVSDQSTETIPPGTVLPLTSLQHLFLSADIENDSDYLEIMFLRTPKVIDLLVLEQVFAAMGAQHDAFGMRFSRTDDRWIQTYVGPGGGISFNHMDAATLKREEFGALRETMLERIKRSINIETGPLVQALLLDRGATGGSLLAIGFHHLVVDAVSLSIWATQFQQAYQNIVSGKKALTRNNQSTFGNWLKRLGEYSAQLPFSGQAEYWQEMCSGFRETSDSLGATMRGSLEERNWHFINRSSLSTELNQKLLNTYTTATERNCLFVAAIAMQSICTLFTSCFVFLVIVCHRAGIILGVSHC